jgi:predicted ArsR family transcriptional regulator
MSVAVVGKRFFESTRGQIVMLLRRGARTVDELAAALELTSNAVRHQIFALERDGLARQVGVRRVGQARKPSAVYELPEDAEPRFSRAYAPVLATLVETCASSLPRHQAEEMLREVGHRLAHACGGESNGPLARRVETAAAVLTTLGGDVGVSREGGALHIRGSGCPLSAAVARQPALCLSVETMLSDIVGSPVAHRCEHGRRPRCRFMIEDVGSAA